MKKYISFVLLITLISICTISSVAADIDDNNTINDVTIVFEDEDNLWRKLLLSKRGWVERSKKHHKEQRVDIFISLPAAKKLALEIECEDKVTMFNRIVQSTIFHELIHIIRYNPIYEYSEEEQSEEAVLAEESECYFGFLEFLEKAVDEEYNAIIFDKDFIDNIVTC